MKILKKLENIFAAAAFAEAGEFETAREMAREDTREREETKRPGYEGQGQNNISQHPSKA